MRMEIDFEDRRRYRTWHLLRDSDTVFAKRCRRGKAAAMGILYSVLARFSSYEKLHQGRVELKNIPAIAPLYGGFFSPPL